MSNLYVFLVVLFSFHESYGVIYHLNDTEYEKLPRLFEMDNYESCMEQPGAVYCVANLELYNDTPNDLYTLIQEYSAHSLKHYNYSKIDIGMCVTRKCKNYAENIGLDIRKELRSVLEGCLNATIKNKYNLSARMYNMNCHEKADEKTHADKIDYIFLTIIIIVVLLNIVGSYFDATIEQNRIELNHNTAGKELLLCFSVFQNMRVLKAVDKDNSRTVVFKGLHGVRVIVTCIVVFAHVQLILGSGFTADPHTFEKAFESVTHRITSSGTVVVQVFFFISGLFFTYLMQVYSEIYNITWKMIPTLVLQRWWRLTPSAAIVIGFMATWMRHVSYGPLWKLYVTSGPVAQCRHYFWAHIFYINNYFSEDTLCAFQTWHIAADMQVFLLGLIVHFIIKDRSHKFKVITLSVLVLTGAAINAIQVWLFDLDAFAMQKPELLRTISDPTFRTLQVLGHNNLTCFVIGMANGYLAYYFSNKKTDWSNFKIGNLLSWCIIPLHVGVIYYGSLYFQDGDRAFLISRMTYAALCKVIIGILVSLWILGNIFKCNDCSRILMEWSGWMPLSKLSYSVFLTHNVFIHILLGVRTQLTPVCFLNCFFTSIGVLVTSYTIALPIYLFVEAPACRTIKILINHKNKRKLS